MFSSCSLSSLLRFSSFYRPARQLLSPSAFSRLFVAGVGRMEGHEKTGGDRD